MRKFMFLMLVAGLLGVPGHVIAAEPPVATKAPEVSKADLEAAMKAMMASMAPGKQHADLAKLAGEWTCECENFMPGQPVEKSTATAKRSMIMGGRFLQEEFKGTMMGMPFDGVMLLGYDNNLKRYTTIWYDSLGTGIMSSTGSVDNAGTMTCQGSMYCPMQKKEIGAKLVTKFINDDHEVFEMHTPGPDGKDMVSMRINYKRKK